MHVTACSTPRRPPARRRGVVLMAELLFSLPILLIGVLAVIQFSMIVSAREELLAASRLGARIAAAGTMNERKQVEDEVDRSIRRALGSGRLSKAEVDVAWADEIPERDREGETDWVRVAIQIPMRQVVPDLLGWTGFTVGDQKIVVATTTKQE